VRDHAKALDQPEQAARALLNRAAKRGEVFQVVRDLFYHADAVRQLADIAAALQDRDGQVTASAFRDRTGVGRKRAIQVLEFFDRVAFTRRVRDAHHVRSDALRRIGGALLPLGASAAAPGAGREASATAQAREHNPATA
jgi:selenocysteine-specific elongation factor